MEKSGSGIHVALQSSGRKTITHGLTNAYTCSHPYTHSPAHTHAFQDPPSWPHFKVFQCTQTTTKNISMSHSKRDELHTDSGETEHIDSDLIIGVD